VCLVKGAYWDTEIKHSQVLGLADYPVFTRKQATDLSYLVCAQRLFAAPDSFYPQLRPTTPTRLWRCWRWRLPVATSSCSACTAWARRCTGR